MLENGELVVDNPNQKLALIKSDSMGVYRIDSSSKFDLEHIGNLSRVQSYDSKLTIDTTLLKENLDSLLLINTGVDVYFMSSGTLSAHNLNDVNFEAFDLTTL